MLHIITLIGFSHFFLFMEWHNIGITTIKHAICAPNVFWKLTKNQITTESIDLTFSNFVTISHLNYREQSISCENSGNSGMVQFAELIQALPHYSMLQHNGRVAALNLVPRKCLRYLETILVIWGGDQSQNLCKVLQSR